MNYYNPIYLQSLRDGILAQHKPARAKRWHLRRTTCSCGQTFLPCPNLAARLAAVDNHLREATAVWRTAEA